MAREDLHFRLRLPAALKALIAEAATRNKRSMTAEMIDRLEESFAREPTAKDARRIYGEELSVQDAFEKRLAALLDTATREALSKAMQEFGMSERSKT